MKTFHVHFTQSVRIKINAESEEAIAEAIKGYSASYIEEYVLGDDHNWVVDDMDETNYTPYPDSVLVDGQFYHHTDIPLVKK
jgi:hypothetical protein